MEKQTLFRPENQTTENIFIVRNKAEIKKMVRFSNLKLVGTVDKGEVWKTRE